MSPQEAIREASFDFPAQLCASGRPLPQATYTTERKSSQQDLAKAVVDSVLDTGVPPLSTLESELGKTRKINMRDSRDMRETTVTTDVASTLAFQLQRSRWDNGIPTKQCGSGSCGISEQTHV